MTDNWDDHASGWDQDEGPRSYADQAFASLIGHVDVRHIAWKNKRILDFGCGTGLLAEKLAPLAREVLAVDISQNMIDVLRGKQIANVTSICADIDDISVQASANWLTDFDLIVASSVCCFLPNYESTLETLSRSLAPAGRFVQWDWLASDDDDFGLTMDRVSNAIGKTGLECVHVGKAFTFTTEDHEMPVLIGVGSAT
jgi:predicted TPR repeat methyltransferase